LAAAAKRTDIIRAIVPSRGRPDLADPYLNRAKAPTLLIVGGYDTPAIRMKQKALEKYTLYLEKKAKKA